MAEPTTPMTGLAIALTGLLGFGPAEVSRDPRGRTVYRFRPQQPMEQVIVTGPPFLSDAEAQRILEAIHETIAEGAE